MEVNIKINKIYLIILCLIIILCSGIIVYAWNSNNPSLMGHTWNEMECTNNLCVKSDGKVGINTQTPEKTLEVEGDFQATNYFSGNGAQGIDLIVAGIEEGDTSKCTLIIRDGLIVDQVNCN